MLDISRFIPGSSKLKDFTIDGKIKCMSCEAAVEQIYIFPGIPNIENKLFCLPCYRNAIKPPAPAAQGQDKQVAV